MLLKLFTVHQNVYEMYLQFELESTFRNIPRIVFKSAGKDLFLGAVFNSATKDISFGAFSRVPQKNCGTFQ